MRNYEDIINNGKLQINTKYNDGNGVIQIRAYYHDPVTQKRYWCKFTRAEGWEHVTVSPQPQRGKTPEWDVMCKIKDIFWDEEECCIEFHPRKSQYINNNETCLHIWKPIGIDLPEPNTLLLGFQGVSSEESGKAIHSVIESLSDEEKFQMAENLGLHIGNRTMKRKAGMK